MDWLAFTDDSEAVKVRSLQRLLEELAHLRAGEKSPRGFLFTFNGYAAK